MIESIWTPERQAQLFRLAEESVRPRDIVKIMGLTKGQVIGKMHRCHLLGSYYDGPNTMQRLDLLENRMNSLLAESRRIKRVALAVLYQGFSND